MNQDLFNECKRRRQNLLQKMDPASIALVISTKENNSDFYYLTGFTEPNAIALFIPSRKEGEYILFTSEPNAEQELWRGELIGQKRACQEYGAAEAFPLSQIDTMLPDLLLNKNKLYFAIGDHKDFDIQVLGWVNKAKKDFTHIGKITHELRLIKSPYEIELIRKSAAIAVAAHSYVMRICKPGMFEYQLEAELQYQYMQHGGSPTSFKPIIAGGNNACVLHYSKNDAVLQDGDLVLIDSGVSYQHYASDISRTIPVGGKFTAEQKAIYQAVLDTELAVIEKIKPGITWAKLEETAKFLIAEKLLALGIKDGCRFYPHRIGHWLGLETHDVGEYQTPFQPGMVFTIEPGIYIPKNSIDIDKKWCGLGVRIEDDILVTENGFEVLTQA